MRQAELLRRNLAKKLTEQHQEQQILEQSVPDQKDVVLESTADSTQNSVDSSPKKKNPFPPKKKKETASVPDAKLE